MTHKKPETPEEEWAALHRGVTSMAEDELEAMSNEEVDASLEEDGFDLAKVNRDGEAFVADLRAQLDAMAAKGAGTAAPTAAAVPPAAAPPTSPPTNVVPFAPKRRRSVPWTVTLLAAALAAALAATTATMIARKDARAPSPTAPPEQVFVEIHHEEIAQMRAKAEASAGQQRWDACLQSLDTADQLVARPPPGPDTLRKRCTDGKVAALRAIAVSASQKKDWAACLISVQAATKLRDDPADDLEGLRKKCTDALVDQDRVKGR